MSLALFMACERAAEGGDHDTIVVEALDIADAALMDELEAFAKVVLRLVKDKREREQVKLHLSNWRDLRPKV